MKFYLTFIALLFLHFTTSAATIEGVIYEADGKTPISFASIAIKGTTKGVNSDLEGYFRIEALSAGQYNLLISFLGYEEVEIKNLELKDNSKEKFKIQLKPAMEELPIVTITAKNKNRKNGSAPASLHTLDAQAIQNGIGSANDIMQTIQSLPGMVSPVGFSNEIMIRGGASVENSYFLDGIELPLINHFSSQGAANGIRSIVNNSMLKKATIYSSAFPIAAGNALSGVFDFTMKNGNSAQLKTNILLSTTDASIALDGPLNEAATYSVVFRQAYLKPTLKLLDRPLLATYNDWQYKIHWNLGQNNTLSFIGIGNTDSKEVNNHASSTPLNQYLFESVLDGKHWHVTNGVKFQNFRAQSYTSIILSNATVFFNLFNQPKIVENRLFQPLTAYTSREKNTQMVIKNTTEWKNSQWIIGGRYQHNYFSSDSKLIQEQVEHEVTTAIAYSDWNIFTEINQQVNANFYWSLGVKIEGNDITRKMNNPLKQISPRLSLVYTFNKIFSINAHAGVYHQLPENITLAYKDYQQELVNMKNAGYFSVQQFNLGFNWKNADKKTNIQVETFYKNYNNYPFSIKDKVVLANKGDGYRKKGAEAILPIGIGRAYGLEISAQKNIVKGLNANLNYTLSRSEFLDETKQKYVASSMDARHVLNVTMTQELPNNWQVGIKGRFQSGLPYTPYDLAASTNIANWNPTNGGIKNYQYLNQQRLTNNFGLDLRVDKTFILKNSTVKVYADLKEMIRSSVSGPAFLAVQKDKNGLPKIDAANPSQYEVALLANELSSFVPTLGIDFQF